ncbi:hypothetical protein FHS14_002291 [Paenibacillus baekrokdamisoli]|nr:hypothetical protein [Paenibacillus baekrokdamisoli]
MLSFPKLFNSIIVLTFEIVHTCESYNNLQTNNRKHERGVILYAS